MKLLVFSVYDRAVDAYMRPWVAQTEGQALRMFSDIANDPNSEVYRHKEHYSLFLIGTFTDHDGELEPCVPKRLAGAHESIVTQNAEPLPLAEVKES